MWTKVLVGVCAICLLVQTGFQYRAYTAEVDIQASHVAAVKAQALSDSVMRAEIAKLLPTAADTSYYIGRMMDGHDPTMTGLKARHLILDSSLDDPTPPILSLLRSLRVARMAGVR